MGGKTAQKAHHTQHPQAQKEPERRVFWAHKPGKVAPFLAVIPDLNMQQTAAGKPGAQFQCRNPNCANPRQQRGGQRQAAEGIQCAVFSNKADPLCGKIIEHYFGAGRFVLVRGSRPGVPTKPDPTGVYSLMQDLHADPASTLFVGDSDVDILTGHNAGLPAMGALWGFRGRAELTAAGADALASVPEDILEYVRTH